MPDEYYIPFDVGSWRANPGQTYRCVRHGLQHGGLIVRATARPGATPVTRQYCGLCVIDALDALIMHPLVPE